MEKAGSFSLFQDLVEITFQQITESLSFGRQHNFNIGLRGSHLVHTLIKIKEKADFVQTILSMFSIKFTCTEKCHYLNNFDCY